MTTDGHAGTHAVTLTVVVVSASHLEAEHIVEDFLLSQAARDLGIISVEDPT